MDEKEALLWWPCLYGGGGTSATIGSRKARSFTLLDFACPDLAEVTFTLGARLMSPQNCSPRTAKLSFLSNLPWAFSLTIAGIAR